MNNSLRSLHRPILDYASVLRAWSFQVAHVISFLGCEITFLLESGKMNGSRKCVNNSDLLRSVASYAFYSFPTWTATKATFSPFKMFMHREEKCVGETIVIENLTWTNLIRRYGSSPKRRSASTHASQAEKHLGSSHGAIMDVHHRWVLVWENSSLVHSEGKTDLWWMWLDWVSKEGQSDKKVLSTDLSQRSFYDEFHTLTVHSSSVLFEF